MIEKSINKNETISERLPDVRDRGRTIPSSGKALVCIWTLFVVQLRDTLQRSEEQVGSSIEIFGKQSTGGATAMVAQSPTINELSGDAPPQRTCKAVALDPIRQV